MNDRAEFVCELEYPPYANSVAECSDCGWPIGRHYMEEVIFNGPFKPSRKHICTPFMLGDFRCAVVYPEDLTATEADRLCAMIQTLPIPLKPGNE